MKLDVLAVSTVFMSLPTLSLLMNFMAEAELLGKMEIVLMLYKKQ